ncbi:unnamed protein product [Staurois parvus]|uniref:Uncharacterized protein n=1 Tax=Staurois parvus TaxID=386267 RepID=A0ABN9AJW8_9NEOB|nr:unnamed protein product [Staurois parvus]
MVSSTFWGSIIDREWLKEHFPGRWLGRRGPHEWPATSPDLTPCDFFLWGLLKEQVYSTKPKTLEELEGRLREVICATRVPAKIS